MKRSQSSLNAFISEENQTDPDNIAHYELISSRNYLNLEKTNCDGGNTTLTIFHDWKNKK